MKKLKLILAGNLLALFLLPGFASADVNDFVITSFKADETLSRNDPQGELHIVEHINVRFSDYNHGLLRSIPQIYESGQPRKQVPLHLKINKITSESGASAKYSTYTSNQNTVIKIGDPDKTVTGNQEYTIDYTLRNVISFYKDHDELYWDVNGDEWNQPFEKVTVSLHLPRGLKQMREPACYAGAFNRNAGVCKLNGNSENIKASTTAPLEPNQTLTYVAGFEKGFFRPSTLLDWLSEYAPQIAKIIVPVLVLGGGSFVYWFRKGRDAKGRGTIVPQYDAPDNLKPLEVGTITDFKVDNKDITATIIDLAVRGYIKIVESKDSRLILKDKLTYTLELLKSDYAQLSSFETKIMNGLFSNASVGQSVDLSAMKTKFYTIASEVRTQAGADLTARGYFKSNPLKSGKVISSIAIGLLALIYLFGTLLGPLMVVGIVIGLVVAFPFIFLMSARTSSGVVAKEHIQGLKMYLETAEKDRLNKLQGPNAQYAANAGEPVKTVDLFEKLLPYAMVLGVERQWANQFKDIYNTPPGWYGGNWSTFNAIYLADTLNSGIGQAVNSAFSAPSSSSGSGFGSGGFSGGGGGGGGGGGW